MTDGPIRNGHDHGGGRHHDGGPRKVASLDDARAERKSREKAAKAAARGSRRPAADTGGRVSLGGWIFGGLVMAMALGMIVLWLLPVLRAAGLQI